MANEKNFITAREIFENPAIYYGADVSNYVAGDFALRWRIYHSDGENVYLVSEPITGAELPKTRSGIKLTASKNDIAFSLEKAILDEAYVNGGKSIDKDNPAGKWLLCLKAGMPVLDNMKAVAYLIDTQVWKVFADEKYAEYAIGCPTLDMLVVSHNQFIESIWERYKLNLKKYILETRVSGEGYLIKNSKNYSNRNEIFIFDPLSNLYGIAGDGYMTSDIIIAAPAHDTWDYNDDYLFHVNNDNLIEKVSLRSYGSLTPIVCLKANTKFTVDKEGNLIIA